MQKLPLITLLYTTALLQPATSTINLQLYSFVAGREIKSQQKISCSTDGYLDDIINSPICKKFCTTIHQKAKPQDFTFTYYNAKHQVELKETQMPLKTTSLFNNKKHLYHRIYLQQKQTFQDQHIIVNIINIPNHFSIAMKNNATIADLRKENCIKKIVEEPPFSYYNQTSEDLIFITKSQNEKRHLIDKDKLSDLTHDKTLNIWLLPDFNIPYTNYLTIEYTGKNGQKCTWDTGYHKNQTIKTIVRDFIDNTQYNQPEQIPYWWQDKFELTYGGNSLAPTKQKDLKYHKIPNKAILTFVKKKKTPYKTKEKGIIAFCKENPYLTIYLSTITLSLISSLIFIFYKNPKEKNKQTPETKQKKHTNPITQKPSSKIQQSIVP